MVDKSTGRWKIVVDLLNLLARDEVLTTVNTL